MVNIYMASKVVKRKRKTFEKKVKEIVNKELAAELEEKNCITEYSGVLIQPSIPSGTVLNGQGNYFKLIPEIFQSTQAGTGRAYNERIGNEIKLLELDINMFLNYVPQSVNNLIANPENQKLAVRVMILRAKEVNDQELLFDNMPTDTLIRFGQQSTGIGGPIAYGGFPLDSFRDINRDTFSVRYDKVHYLNCGSSVFPGTSNPDLAIMPSGMKMIRHKLKFGKSGLTLKYSASADTQPNNMPYFMVIGYSSLSANAVPASGLVQATVNVAGKYRDA